MSRQDEIAQTVANYLDAMSKLGVKTLIYFNDDQSRCAGLTSNMTAKIMSESDLISLTNTLSDLDCLEMDGKVPQSVSIPRNLLTYAINMYERLKTDDSYIATKYRNFKKGKIEKLTQEEIDNFLDNGYCPGDVPPEIKRF